MSVKELNSAGFNGLKILCVLSVIGFIYSMANDSVSYYVFNNYEENLNTDNAQLKEQLDDKTSILEKNGIDVSEKGIEKIAWMYIGRAIIDVLALLGVVLMFYRLKLGFNIYVIFPFPSVFWNFYLYRVR